MEDLERRLRELHDGPCVCKSPECELLQLARTAAAIGAEERENQIKAAFRGSKSTALIRYLRYGK